MKTEIAHSWWHKWFTRLAVICSGYVVIEGVDQIVEKLFDTHLDLGLFANHPILWADFRGFALLIFWVHWLVTLFETRKVWGTILVVSVTVGGCMYSAHKSANESMKHAGMELCVAHRRLFRADPAPPINSMPGGIGIPAINNVYDLSTDPKLFEDMQACVDEDKR